MGWGEYNYIYIFEKYYDEVSIKERGVFDKSHNDFLDKLSQNGIIGFTLYLLIFYILIKVFIESRVLSLKEKSL